MAEDQPRRVTLEDYSSSAMPQFFTSIVRPEVQAHNITYPHSMIQLIQDKTRVHTCQLTLKFAIKSSLQVCRKMLCS